MSACTLSIEDRVNLLDTCKKMLKNNHKLDESIKKLTEQLKNDTAKTAIEVTPADLQFLNMVWKNTWEYAPLNVKLKSFHSNFFKLKRYFIDQYGYFRCILIFGKNDRGTYILNLDADDTKKVLDSGIIVKDTNSEKLYNEVTKNKKLQIKVVGTLRQKNKIVGYTIADVTGKRINVARDVLKDKIRSNEVNVVNATLSRDGRLFIKKIGIVIDKMYFIWYNVKVR